MQPEENISMRQGGLLVDEMLLPAEGYGRMTGKIHHVLSLTFKCILDTAVRFQARQSGIGKELLGVTAPTMKRTEQWFLNRPSFIAISTMPAPHASIARE
jgi:hypothetical protein